MEYMRTLPDGYFDLAIVDPPYGDALTFLPQRAVSRMGGNWFTKYKRVDEVRSAVRPIQASKGTSGDAFRDTAANHPPENGSKTGIWWDVAPSQEYFDELFRVSKNQIIWGGNYFALPPTRCFLVWRKLSISEKFSMAMAEYAWTSFNANAKVFECTPQGTKNEPRFHPTQKPVKLYTWLMENFAKEGDRILDTHLGSGSSRIAAFNLSLDFVGCEIDKQYFDMQEARFKRECLDKPKFDF